MTGAAARGSGSQHAYFALRERILTLELAPGTRLFEEGVAASLGLSRTPLREALRQLVSEGLLERQPTGGIAVPELNTQEISDLYEVRAALESLMAGAAAVAATQADILQLAAITETNAALLHQPEAAMRFGTALHTAVGEIAGNRWAVRLHDQVANQMERYRPFSNNSAARRATALEEHRALVAMIAAGDVSGARSLAFSHVMGAGDEAVRAISIGLDQ